MDSPAISSAAQPSARSRLLKPGTEATGRLNDARAGRARAVIGGQAAVTSVLHGFMSWGIAFRAAIALLFAHEAMRKKCPSAAWP